VVQTAYIVCVKRCSSKNIDKFHLLRNTSTGPAVFLQIQISRRNRVIEVTLIVVLQSCGDDVTVVSENLTVIPEVTVCDQKSRVNRSYRHSDISRELSVRNLISTEVSFACLQWRSARLAQARCL